VNLASYITLLRIFLIFPIIYIVSLETNYLNWLALFLFIFAGLTDYLDGYIARRTKTESSLGALLDLLADKLLVCIVLLWVVYIYQKINLLFPVMIIISRELIISSIRQYIVQKVGRNPIKVTYIAKSKTTFQFISISFLIISPNFGVLFNEITLMLLWFASIISIYSLYNYLRVYKEYLR